MELAVLAGLILIVVGAITTNPTQLGIGLALGSLGGLELSIREHFAGYRSHTTLLAGVVFVLATGLTFFFAGEIPGVRAPELWMCLVVGVTLGRRRLGLAPPDLREEGRRPLQAALAARPSLTGTAGRFRDRPWSVWLRPKRKSSVRAELADQEHSLALGQSVEPLVLAQAD